MSKVNLTAKQLVAGLDKHIVGQDAAKKKVAIAVTNRWRRAALPVEQQKDIIPKNILLVGPSGVGKTEIARRLAAQVHAPFLKVEATKFTEVGYVGQDVEKIIKDLVEVAVRNEQDLLEKKNIKAAEKKAFSTLLALMVEPKVCKVPNDIAELKDMIASGELDKVYVDVELPSLSAAVEIIVPPGLEEMSQQIEQLFKSVGSDKVQSKRVSVPQAFKLIVGYELDKFIDAEDITDTALEKVENYGVVFIDEIDKLIAKGNSSNSDISRGGVQRDLLPLLEGTVVSTKYGPVATDHILFIASGAFLESKPTDLASELQGRLPVVVNLDALTKSDLVKILKEPSASLINQYKWLLSSDGVKLSFSDEAIDLIAETAFSMNKDIVNLGARRLTIVLESVLEPILFNPGSAKEQLIDVKKVQSQVKNLLSKREDSKWVL